MTLPPGKKPPSGVIETVVTKAPPISSKPVPQLTEDTVPATSPVLGAGGASSAAAADLVKLVAEQRPDLLPALLQMDRASKVDGPLQHEMREQRREIVGLLQRLEQVLGATQGSVDKAGQLSGAAALERQRALDEARTVADKYKSMWERAVAERDNLSQQANELRSRASAELKEQTQAVVELQRSFARERQASNDKLTAADASAATLRQRVAELEKEAAEALASRDRIAERVRKVEERIEKEAIPLREKLEAAQAQVTALKTQLEAVRAELSAVKILR